MVGDDHALKAVVAVEGQRAHHVHVARVDELLVVAGQLAAHVAEVDVGDLVHPGEVVDGVVDVVVAKGHLGEGALAELHHVVIRRVAAEVLVVAVHAHHQAVDAAHHGHRRVVGVDGHLDARLLGHGQYAVHEPVVALPHLLQRHVAHVALGILHLLAPDEAVGQGLVEVLVRVLVVHGRDRAAAGVGQHLAPRHRRQREVVAHDGDARLAHVADGALYVLQLLLAAGACGEDVVPVRGLEVLDGLQLEPVALHLPDQRLEVLLRPVAVLGGGQHVLIGDVDHDVADADLLGKVQRVVAVRARIKPKTHLHCFCSSGLY